MATISASTTPSNFKFCQCPSDILHWYFFFLVWASSRITWHTIVMSCWFLLWNISLVFLHFDIFRVVTTYQVSLNLGLSDILSRLDSGYMFSAHMPWKSCYVFLSTPGSRHMTSVYPMAAAGAVNCGHEFKVMAAGFLGSLISSSIL